jgi:hypothetical protein
MWYGQRAVGGTSHAAILVPSYLKKPYVLEQTSLWTAEIICVEISLRSVGLIPMHDYEIRLYDKAGKLSLLYSSNYLGDEAAIQAAQKHCRAGDVVEVWRDQVCVFTDGSPKEARA